MISSKVNFLLSFDKKNPYVMNGNSPFFSPLLWELMLVYAV